MKTYIYNTKKIETFDTRRHVATAIDDEAKRVTVFLNCKADEAAMKFHKTIRALGTSFRGYDIVATVAISDAMLLTMTARIH